MDEDQIQLHPSKDDGFNDNETNNETGANVGEADNEQENEEDLPEDSYVVKKVHEYKLKEDGTYAYLIEWRDYPDLPKEWTNEVDVTLAVIETWGLPYTIPKSTHLPAQKPKIECEIQTNAVTQMEEQQTESVMIEERKDDKNVDPLGPSKVKKMKTEPPCVINYVDPDTNEEASTSKAQKTGGKKETEEITKIESDEDSSSSSSSGEESSGSSSSSSDSSDSSSWSGKDETKKRKKLSSNKKPPKQTMVIEKAVIEKAIVKSPIKNSGQTNKKGNKSSTSKEKNENNAARTAVKTKGAVETQMEEADRARKAEEIKKKAEEMKRADDMVARVNENVVKRKETATNNNEQHKPEMKNNFKITDKPGGHKKVITRIKPPQKDEPSKEQVESPPPPSPSTRPPEGSSRASRRARRRSHSRSPPHTRRHGRSGDNEVSSSRPGPYGWRPEDDMKLNDARRESRSRSRSPYNRRRPREDEHYPEYYDRRSYGSRRVEGNDDFHKIKRRRYSPDRRDNSRSRSTGSRSPGHARIHKEEQGESSYLRDEPTRHKSTHNQRSRTSSLSSSKNQEGRGQEVVTNNDGNRGDNKRGKTPTKAETSREIKKDNTSTKDQTAKKALEDQVGETGNNPSTYQISRYKHCSNLTCGAMFMHMNGLTDHRKLCDLFKMVRAEDIDGLIQITKLLAESGLIKLEDWTKVVKHGIRMWKESEKKLEDRMTNKSTRTNEENIQIVKEVQDSTYGESVKAGQWGFRPVTNKENPVERDPSDPENIRYRKGEKQLEENLDNIFVPLTNPKEMRAVRSLAETRTRKNIEVITYDEMSLVVGAINKMLKNLTSATKKRDSNTFRSQLPLIQKMITRELDRIMVSATMLTKTEDIQTTLTMIKDQLSELKKSDSLGNQESMSNAQQENIRKTHKKIKKLLRSIKRKIIGKQEKLKRRSASGSTPQEGGE